MVKHQTGIAKTVEDNVRQAMLEPNIQKMIKPYREWAGGQKRKENYNKGSGTDNKGGNTDNNKNNNNTDKSSGKGFTVVRNNNNKGKGKGKGAGGVRP